MIINTIPIPIIKRRKRKLHTPGVGPSALIAQTELPKPTIQLIVYNTNQYEISKVNPEIFDQSMISEHGLNSWVDVQGLGDTQLIKYIGENFGLHPLTIEDIVNIHQRPTR